MSEPARPGTARLGATRLGEGRCRFLVWAPQAKSVEVHIVSPAERVLPLAAQPRGYFGGVLPEVGPGTLYTYRLDGGREFPDPASRSQPRGVHGPSLVTASEFRWEDTHWIGPRLADYVLYELHVGTFTAEGTFAAAIAHLDEIADLGVTAVELMPVAQFPGSRNWGYDGVCPFAVHGSYGGQQELKRLVAACHRRGLAVVLDVVYNHLGPEGNYLGEFGFYFTDRYRTPWGAALNFDGPYSDEVRRYFIENALYWVEEFHVDALRLDAVHAILDHSARPFLEELAEAVHERARRLGRRVYVIAESHLNDARLARSPQRGGLGLDAQWGDDFHHSLHALLTGERTGYYGDFGQVDHLARAWRDGFVYAGEYSAYRRRCHGSSSRDIAPGRLVVCAQNHDQVGNRLMGERLSHLLSFSRLKLAAAAVLLSPYLPQLFMGEEYGETAPFPYFISHTAPDLIAAVRNGRREEFAAFGWRDEPPDPQGEDTFQGAKLDRRLRDKEPHRTLLEFYRELIRLRREVSALTPARRDGVEVSSCEDSGVLCIRNRRDADEALLIFNFGAGVAPLTVPASQGRWEKRLDSAAECWRGPGSALPPALSCDERLSVSAPGETVLLFARA